jgi:hypothetical protein
MPALRPLAIAWLLFAAACGMEDAPSLNPAPCSAEWQQWVESRLTTGDAHGHGPDIGSAEWQSVVEFKLGIRDDPSVPSRESDEWCRYIDERIRAD